MSKVIAIANQKGGVAKTSTTYNLGVGLSRAGKKVLLIDADPQGDLTSYAGIDRVDELEMTLGTIMNHIINGYALPDDIIIKCAEGVDLVPSNIDLATIETLLLSLMIGREKVLKRFVDEIKDNYDYVLIDCMPSLGSIPINAMACADSIIIPSQAHFFSFKGMAELVKTINIVRENCNPNLKVDGILLTLFDKRTKLAKAIEEVMGINYGGSFKVFSSVIPLSTKVAESSAKGKSVFSYDPKGNATQMYQNFVMEVLGV